MVAGRSQLGPDRQRFRQASIQVGLAGFDRKLEKVVIYQKSPIRIVVERNLVRTALRNVRLWPQSGHPQYGLQATCLRSPKRATAYVSVAKDGPQSSKQRRGPTLPINDVIPFVHSRWIDRRHAAVGAIGVGGWRASRPG